MAGSAKERSCSRAKEGRRENGTVYSSGTFGTSGEYNIVNPFEKFAEFDGENPLITALGEAGAGRLIEKLRKCLVSQNAFSVTRLDELSNLIPGAPPPGVVVFVRYRVAPGKMQEFQSLVRSDILPVYKKAKVGLTVTRRGPGANTADVSLGTQYSRYADLDGGPLLLKQLGPDGYSKLGAKIAGLATQVEVVVRRRVPDLSF